MSPADKLTQNFQEEKNMCDEIILFLSNFGCLQIIVKFVTWRTGLSSAFDLVQCHQPNPTLFPLFKKLETGMWIIKDTIDLLTSKTRIRGMLVKSSLNFLKMLGITTWIITAKGIKMHLPVKPPLREHLSNILLNSPVYDL